MIKKIFIAFLLTIIIGVIVTTISEYQTGYASLGILFAIFIWSPINIAFLLILYYLKLGREYLINIKYLLIEICLFYLLIFCVDELINNLLKKYLFEKFPNNVTSLKFYFEDSFQIVYVYFALFTVLMIIRLIVAIFKKHFLPFRTRHKNKIKPTNIGK